MAVGTIYMQNSCKQKRSYIPFRTRPFHEMFSLLLLFVSRLFLEMWKYEQKVQVPVLTTNWRGDCYKY